LTSYQQENTGGFFFGAPL